jgi:SAM-dependent methyltransferase
MDKVPHRYWDDMWLTDALPTSLDFSLGVRVKPISRHIRDFVVAHIEHLGPAPVVVEVGCGGSVCLPYFRQVLGWRAACVDYSSRGCALARRVLESAGADVSVYWCDLFAPLPELFETFDAVVSLGAVEHVVPTSRVIGALARFIRPGGVVFTMVRHMTGRLGALQKRLNRPIYELHVPLTPASLAQAHADAGLEVLEACYVSTAEVRTRRCSAPGSRSKPFGSCQRCCGWPRTCPALCSRRSGCPRTSDARRAGRVDVAVYNRA